MLHNTFFVKPESEEDGEIEISSNEPANHSSEALELPVDLIETPGHLIARFPIAGGGIHDINISLNADRLTLKKFSSVTEPDDIVKHHLEECYWGELERNIELPKPVDPDHTRASLQDGILVVTMPIASRNRSKIIHIEDE